MTKKGPAASFRPDGREPRKSVVVEEGRTADETERNIAAVVTSPQLAACRVINASDAKALGELIDVPELMAELRRQAEAVNRGELP